MPKVFYNYGLRCGECPENTLLYHTVKAQQKLKLPWIKRFQEIDTSFSPNPRTILSKHASPTTTLTNGLKRMFKAIWSGALQQSKKLQLLKSIKTDWGPAPYLNELSFNQRKNITRLRLSAHRLPIELGRYTVPLTPQEKRLCKLCQTALNIHTIGDESHLLFDCLAGENIRKYVGGHLKLAINCHDIHILLNLEGKNLREFGIYTNKVYSTYTNTI